MCKRLHRMGLALVVVAAACFWGFSSLRAGEPAAEAKPREGVVGSWLGTLDAGIKIRVVFNIRQLPEDKLAATLDSPDQGAKGIKFDQVQFADGKLSLQVKAIGGSFEGKLDPARGEISGTWTQGGAPLALVLRPIDKLPELARPQEPKKPYPYDEETVSYENSKAGVTIAGTLTLPRGPGPFAAVLLITGSGAQDRDESLLGHKPFAVLADYLTRRGIAVLRVDDRGIGGSSGNLNNATTEDLAGDALVGVEFLKKHARIDPNRIGLLGHSEGGLIAPLAATKSNDVAFIVLIAGPAVTGEEIMLAQGQLILKAAGAAEAALAKQRQVQERMFAIVKQYDQQLRDRPNDPPDAAQAEKNFIAVLTDVDPKRFSNAAAARAETAPLLTPWFRFFLTYDPRPTLAKVRCPILSVIGQRDLQVPCQENLAEAEKALSAAGHKDYTLREMPGLNHLLQTCKTGSPSEYGQIEETIAPAALETIGDWIVKRTEPATMR